MVPPARGPFRAGCPSRMGGHPARAGRWNCAGKGRRSGWRLRSGSGRSSQGSAEDGSLHPVRTGRRGRGHCTSGMESFRRTLARVHGDHHRVGYRRLSGNRRGSSHHRSARDQAPLTLHGALLSRKISRPVIFPSATASRVPSVRPLPLAPRACRRSAMPHASFEPAKPMLRFAVARKPASTL